MAKIMVDLILIQDLSTAVELLFNIVKEKELDDDEVEKMRYVAKLMQSSTEILKKNTEETNN